jgi:hypothetical protein
MSVMTEIRKFRRGIVFLTTFALVMCFLSEMKTDSSAATQTFNIVNRTINPGEGFNVATNRAFRAGDIVQFSLIVTKLAAVPSVVIEFGVAQSNGTFLAGSRRQTLTGISTAINFTVQVGQTGNFNIRIANRNPLTGSLTIMDGRCTHRPRLSHDLIIRYDTTASTHYAGAPYAESAIRTAFSEATREFDRFGIFYNWNSPAISFDLNGGDCPEPRRESCRLPGLIFNYCGALNRCATAHHKSDTRINSILRLPNTHVLRVVGHTLCYSSGANHRTSGGIATVRGRDSTVTTVWDTSLAFLIQHELSHNLGASHTTCLWTPTNNVRCALGYNEHNEDINNWCTSCTQAIFAHRG